jgi:hypothetical protein
MKFTVFASLCGSVAAFQVGAPCTHRSSRVVPLPLLMSTVGGETSSSSSTPSTGTASSVDVATSLAKTELLETARDLKEQYGCLLIDSSAQDTLREAVEKLEMLSDPPTDTTSLVGDWTLLCSTASASLQAGSLDKINGIDTSKLPFFNEGPLKEIRDAINKSLRVEQLIKTENGDITRVDHVLQYMPPDTLSAFLNNLPDAIKSLNINPLQVSQGKVILVHKAEVESVLPVIKTKLALSSIIGK